MAGVAMPYNKELGLSFPPLLCTGVPMARSLTIHQEETASTTPLLTGFLILSMVLLVIGALFGSFSSAAVVTEAAVAIP